LRNIFIVKEVTAAQCSGLNKIYYFSAPFFPSENSRVFAAFVERHADFIVFRYKFNAP